jgi:hypothetical protein
VVRAMADRARIYRDLYSTVRPIHRRLRAGAPGGARTEG